ncbi:PaaI family thioesterase [Ralstonia insidiosa]|uniref:PaaI family thioesterase n=1 Tax=Ralstonia insidiosa TaxID=190721 RepID=A0A848NYQ0_9RALS|nr:PaaI family thioesterase [Ralstonia insidiosa]NMV38073.1 PaaI family thioesterase [Ralstonia insidiosa]
MSELVGPSASTISPDDAPPEGFVLLQATRGFIAQLGNLYWHAEKRAMGLRIEARHLNRLGVPHGGMLATVADTAIGIALNRHSDAKHPSVTAHLSIDYLNSARAGDWIEAHVDIDKLGARLHFATCRLISGDQCLLKANATFAVIKSR